MSRFEPDVGSYTMAMPPTPATDFSLQATEAIFAVLTRYYPYDGQGRCIKEPEDSKLLRAGGNFLIESIVVRPGSTNIVSVYNGNNEIIWQTQMGGVSAPQDILEGRPILSVGLFSIEFSNLTARPSVAFRVVQ